MFRFSLSYTPTECKNSEHKRLLSAAEVVAETLRDIIANVDGA